jgi:hypothetical protein
MTLSANSVFSRRPFEEGDFPRRFVNRSTDSDGGEADRAVEQSRSERAAEEP